MLVRLAKQGWAVAAHQAVDHEVNEYYHPALDETISLFLGRSIVVFCVLFEYSEPCIFTLIVSAM